VKACQTDRQRDASGPHRNWWDAQLKQHRAGAAHMQADAASKRPTDADQVTGPDSQLQELPQKPPRPRFGRLVVACKCLRLKKYGP